MLRCHDGRILRVENRAFLDIELHADADAMQPIGALRVYEKNAWVLVTILGAIGMVYSLMMLAGIQDDPAFPAYSSSALYVARVGGISLLGMAAFGIAISYTAFKNGERWAWYAIWYMPVYFIFITADNYLQGGVSWQLTSLLLLISLAALVLPYRVFFPKK